MLECVVHILASVAACVAVTCAAFFDSVVISSPKCVKGQKNCYCDGVTSHTFLLFLPVRLEIF